MATAQTDNNDLPGVRRVGGYSYEVAVIPAVSTTPAYSSGDCVGGKLTLSNAVRVGAGGALLTDLMVLDKGNQKAPLTLLIYDANPSAATLTDNAALVNSTDDVKVLGKVNITAADYETVNTKAYAHIRNIAAICIPASGTTLYAALLTTGTPTYASTSDLKLRFKFAVD